MITTSFHPDDTTTAPDLKGKVALVTGATRGVGRGVAVALAESGCTVYITGRTTREGQGREGLPGSLESVVREIEDRGGRGVGVRCDHRSDDETRAVFERIDREQGRLDILVNNVWGGYEGLVVEGRHVDGDPFWQQPISRWDSMFQAGVRAHFVCSVEAAGRMTRAGSGLMVTISFWAAQRFLSGVAYGSAKAADDKMVADMAHQLRPYGVASVSLYPGLVRTEYVMRFADYLDLSRSESPELTGRAVRALAADPRIVERTGQVLIAAALAREYGFTDVDGNQPVVLTLETAG